MGNYTMSIYEIINNFFTRQEVESWFSSYELSDYLTPKQIETITKAGMWSKEKLAKKIVDNYLMREIGFETFALFRHNAKIKMEKIMEEKLPIIYTNSIEYDPLINVDYTETFKRNIESSGTNSGTSDSNSSNNSSGLNVGSDTPQGQISKQSILNGDYASETNASETESSIHDFTETNGEASNNTNESYTKNIKGNSGVSATYQKMIEQFRQNIRAIDNEIIEELDSLFFQLF